METNNSQKSSGNSEKKQEISQSSKNTWEKAYRVLEETTKSLKFPTDQNLQNLDKAIVSARKAENTLTILLIKSNRKLLRLKREHANKKRELEIRKNGLLIEEDFGPGMTKAEKEFMAESNFPDLVDSVEDLSIEIKEVTTYSNMVEHVMSTVRHLREDVSKKLKLIDIRKEISA